MKENYDNTNLQEIREEYIRELAKVELYGESTTDKAREMADDLFALDLTVYSRNYSFKSLVYNAFSTSQIDENISLHPEQMQIIAHIENTEASIISAPTSFGKTFCVFEYIIKHKPHNIVLVVPTLALVDEYFKRIIKKYREKFALYKVHTNINDDSKYDFSSYNIFILTHDRIVSEPAYSKIEIIDFLVIDEVYKLETDRANDRVLVLNMAYYHLAKKAAKYTLLAPFIKEVLDCDVLEKSPVFFRSNYSPVINNVSIHEIINENDRFSECKKIIDKLKPSDKTLVFFPTVTRMYKYITDVISEVPVLETLPKEIFYFIQWAKEEIHEDWCLITALERGYIIHNGQIPVGTRMFQLDRYESNAQYNRMLCTSTLLEGVNTTAKNIIITKPSRRSFRAGEAPFAAFDFFNLVGRTGRLFQHYIGNAYYIKSPNDPIFKKAEAIKSIKFEISDDSKDIDIQKGIIDKYPDVIEFFKKLNITHSEYLEFIGTRMRFETVMDIYSRYTLKKRDLLSALSKFCSNNKQGRHPLIKEIYNIIEPIENRLRISLITSLLSKQRPRIKKVVDDARKYFPSDINYLISEAIKIKAGYIEHSFYKKASVIRFFMEKDGIKQEFKDVFDEKVLHAIEFLYFTSAKHKKMLVDLGIYERDVDKIVKIIGDDFLDAVELRKLLSINLGEIMKSKNISYISKYIIQGII